MAISRAQPAPLPGKVTALLQESRWIVLVVVALYLALILLTYNKADPGWSHSAADGLVRNLGGRLGAWLSDLMLFLLGMSAYWAILLCAYAVHWNYRSLAQLREDTGASRSRRGSPTSTSALDRRPLYIGLTGFGLLMIASAGIEALRLHWFNATLPAVPGGMIGDIVARALSTTVGITGATLLLFAVFAVGVSLFTGLSWLTIIERIGAALELGWARIGQWREQKADVKVGTLARASREAVVAIEKRKVAELPPIKIEPPVMEIIKSERVRKEKQAPLFAELPDTPLPPLSLLEDPPAERVTVSAETLEYTSRTIERKLKEFGVEVRVLAAYPGPVVTRYEIEPAVGVKGAQIVNLVKDLARSLSVVSIRVVETIPGKSCMGMEIPNVHRQVVKLQEILTSEVYHAMNSPLTLALGKDISGQPVVADLAKMPHLLVAGTTGSGKSVAVNAMILSLLYKAEARDVRMIMIDPKMLELSVYQDIPQLLAPVVTDMRQAGYALNWCVGEMERRYKLMSFVGVRNLAGYNTKLAEAEKKGQPLYDPLAIQTDDKVPLTKLPHIVVVIDEFADLIIVVGKKVEELIQRLAQKARAAGIHLILATQRPSVDVITGIIKANIPTRIAFQVSSRVDSRTILDQMGAETLLGQGDMLYLPPGTGLPQRVHGAFVTDAEVHRVVDHLKALGKPDYVDGLLDGSSEITMNALGTVDLGLGGDSADPERDELYDQAVQVVLQTRRASISLVQRHQRIGYNRAARLLEAMEKAGMVSSMQTNGNRDILVPAKAGQEA